MRLFIAWLNQEQERLLAHRRGQEELDRRSIATQREGYGLYPEMKPGAYWRERQRVEGLTLMSLYGRKPEERLAYIERQLDKSYDPWYWHGVWLVEVGEI